jgi:hypothetical protein
MRDLFIRSEDRCALELLPRSHITVSDEPIEGDDPTKLFISHGPTQWRFDRLHNGRVLRVTTGGLMDLDAHIGMMQDLLAQRDSSGARLLMIDERPATLRLSTLDIYNMPLIYRRLGVRGDERAAILYTPEQRADAFFYEARALHLGFMHQAFTNEHEAMRWLLALPGGRGWRWRRGGSED